jgi:RsiW-degrading membrane proteinase PrsW (M82 family)
MNTGYVALNIFILIALCWIFISPLFKQLKKKKIKFTDFFLKPKVEFGMFYVFLFTIIAIVYISMIKPENELFEPDDKLENIRNEDLYELKYFQYYNKVLKNKYDFESVYFLHYFKQLSDDKGGFKDIYHPLRGRSNYSSYDYETIADTSKNSKDKDLGYFGAAVTKILYYKKHDEAKELLDKIKFRKKPFLNYLYSLTSDDVEETKLHLKKEIEYSGSVALATYRLGNIYQRFDDEKGLSELYNNKYLQNYLPNYVKMEYAFKHFYLIDFFRFDLERTFNYTTKFIAFGALLILFIWYFFLLSIDPFEKEKTKRIILTFTLSVATTFLSSYLYLFVHQMGIHESSENMLSQLFYYIGIVGGIEELVKLIPLLIVIRFTKGITEPIDYLFYGGISALTFSVIEDFMYFNNYSINTIYVRAVFTSLGHIGLTTIISYSFVLANYFYKKNKILIVLAGFVVACVTHGVYDFFAVNDFTGSTFITTFILCLEIWWISHATNNCLNNSEHFDDNIGLKTKNIAIVVSSGLFLLIILVYINTAHYISEDYASWNLFIALIYYSYPIFFIKVCISRIDIFKGEWDNFSMRKFLNPKFFFAGIYHQYSRLVGSAILIQPYGKHTKKMAAHLPLKTIISKREKIGEYKGWFKVELNSPLLIDGKFISTIFIRTKEDEEPISDEVRNLVAIYTYKKPDFSDKIVLEPTDLKFIDWVFLYLPQNQI